LFGYVVTVLGFVVADVADSVGLRVGLLLPVYVTLLIVYCYDLFCYVTVPLRLWFIRCFVTVLRLFVWFTLHGFYGFVASFVDWLLFVTLFGCLVSV